MKKIINVYCLWKIKLFSVICFLIHNNTNTYIFEGCFIKSYSKFIL
jgi:hypothetical protein